MNQILIFIFTLLIAFSSFAKDISLSQGWEFKLSDEAVYKNSNFDDSGWRVLNIPHDWALENGYSIDGAQSEQGGYAIGGVAWYRKSLELSKEDLASPHIFIDFDGVYMNSEVWINGEYLGKRAYGYIPFSYEITKYLKEGENLLSVRVDNSKEPSARWYHVCGIHGNVYLRSKEASYFEKDGTFLRTSEIKSSSAKLDVSTEIISDTERSVHLDFIVLDSQDNEILKDSKPLNLKKGLQEIDISSVLKNPKLWSPESPVLYRAKLNIFSDNKDLLDSQDFAFGVRSIEWNNQKGFFLNGKQYKLQGLCEHLEGATALNTEKIWRWKLQLIKDMGANAVRTAHNPFLPEFYELCNEIGLLVLDEAFDGWSKKAKHDYGAVAFESDWRKDLTAFIRRDRNHPCVFLYSVGNETRGKVAKELVALCHELDPTRLVTSGSAEHGDMDIDGWNGSSENLPFMTKYKPKGKPYLGTEHPHTWQVRGFYRSQTWYRNGANDAKQKPVKIPNLTKEEIFTYDWCNPAERKSPKQVFNSSYDNATKSTTTRHSIEWMRKYDWNSGSFRWTGFDYRGEAGYVHGGYPYRAFMGGALDLAGFKKDLYYLYQSEWTNVDMVHILPHWTHPRMAKGELIPVRVYTTGDEVELFLNKKSLGRIKKGKTWDKMACDWLVAWEEGVVEAVAYRNGKEIARAKQESASSPANLDVSIDESLKADSNHINIVTIRQVDDKGILYPYGENRVYVKIFGAAKVLSFENGNPIDLENNYEAESRRSFFGLNRIFVQSTGGNASEGVSMILAVIGGDKQLTLSDKVSIDVQEISLRGLIKAKKLEVFYTTDGTEVTKNSTLYKGAFPVELGSTVKAKVYFKDDVIFDMQERFAENEGLYWGDSL